MNFYFLSFYYNKNKYKMNDINENFEINEEEKEVYLLYGQYLELLRLYYSKFDPVRFKKLESYIFVDKNWLNEYKRNFNFELIKKKAEKYQYDDFYIYKSKIKEKIERSSRPVMKNKKPKLKSLQKNQIFDDIYIPTNFEIIKRGVFDSFFERENCFYTLIIGERNIFIFDNKNEDSDKMTIFVASLQFNENNDDITDFNINIDYIFIFSSVNERKAFFDMINKGGGLNCYFKFRNINENYFQKQDIFHNNESNFINVGTFIPINRNNNILEKNDKLFSLDYLKSRYSDYFNKKSKCITIYGNLYYYLNDQGPNFNISEYNNNMA